MRLSCDTLEKVIDASNAAASINGVFYEYDYYK
jgi:hypothetical protein